MWLLWVIPGYYGLFRVIMSLLVLVFTYTRRQINLYRMLFADFSVDSQPIFMKFCMDYLRITRRLP